MLPFSFFDYNGSQFQVYRSRMLVPGPVPGKPAKKETPLSKIARRKFIQLSAVAVAGALAAPGRRAYAQDEMPKLAEDDAMATAMKYTHDASTYDPATRVNPPADQN